MCIVIRQCLIRDLLSSKFYTLPFKGQMEFISKSVVPEGCERPAQLFQMLTQLLKFGRKVNLGKPSDVLIT